MGVTVIDTLQRGGLGTAQFAITRDADVQAAYTVVADLTARDALATWRRLPYMRVHVVSNGNDYRLGSDVTIPGQVWTLVESLNAYQLLSEKDQPNGYVGLDANSKINSSFIDNIYSNASFVTANTTTRNALTTLTGDIIVTTDDSKIWVKLNNNPPVNVNGDFAELLFPGNVLSVNGMTGAVSVTIANLLLYGSGTTDFNNQVAIAPAVTNLNSITGTHTTNITTLFGNIANVQTYAETHIGLADLNPLAANPTGAEIGYSLVWNGTEYVLSNISGGGGGFTNPMTTIGDLILGSTGGAATRLAIGANTYVLTSDGTTASWQPSSGGGASWLLASGGNLTGNNLIDTTAAYTLTFDYDTRFETALTTVIRATAGGTADTPYLSFRGDSTRTLADGVSDVFLGTGNGNPVAARAAGNIGIGTGNIQALTPGASWTGSPWWSYFQGDRNVAIGFENGKALTTGTSNVLIGLRTIAVSPTMAYNVAIGFHTMENTTFTAGSGNGQSNVAIGNYVMQNTSAGEVEFTVAIGASISRYLTSVGNANTFIGPAILVGSVGTPIVAIGNSNTFIGGSIAAAATFTSTAVDGNTAVGLNIFRNAVDGLNQSTAIGISTMRYGGGTDNSAMGRAAGWSLRGTGNTALGTESAFVLDAVYSGSVTSGTPFTGTNSTFIGYRSGYATASAAISNVLVIGNNYQPTLTASNAYIGGFTKLNLAQLTDYVADYSGSYTNRSLVDKEYVDSIAGGGAAWLLASGGTLIGNNSIIGTGFTLTGTWNSLGTTQTNGYGWHLRNTTAAAAGAQQISPSIVWEGQGWKTNATAASQPVRFAADVLPIEGTTAASGLWRLKVSYDGGAYTDLFTIDSANATYSGNTLLGTSHVQFNNQLRDNKANPIITQSLSGVVSNRLLTFGGTTYSSIEIINTANGGVLIDGNLAGTLTANTRLDVRGIGTTSATLNLRLADSANNVYLTVSDAGTITSVPISGFATISFNGAASLGSTSNGNNYISGGTGVLINGNISTSSNNVLTIVNGGSFTGTSGTQRGQLINVVLAPTSGTATFKGLEFTNTLNTTGSYSGIVYGIDYNPTLTSLTGATHLAWRNTSGSVLIGHTALGSSTTRLQVRGIGTTTNILALFENSSGTQTLSVLDNGLTTFGSGSGEFIRIDNTAGNAELKYYTGGTLKFTSFVSGSNYRVEGSGNILLRSTGTTISDLSGSFVWAAFNPTSILFPTPSGSATSTATQQNGALIDLRSNYWNGAAQAQGSIRLQTIASTTVNRRGRLSFTETISAGSSIELMSLSNMGYLTLNITPNNDDALTQVLVRDGTTGEVKYRTAASLGGGGGWPLTGSATLTGNVTILGGSVDYTAPVYSINLGTGARKLDAFTIHASSSGTGIQLVNEDFGIGGPISQAIIGIGEVSFNLTNSSPSTGSHYFGPDTYRLSESVNATDFHVNVLPGTVELYFTDIAASGGEAFIRYQTTGTSDGVLTITNSSAGTTGNLVIEAGTDLLLNGGAFTGSVLIDAGGDIKLRTTSTAGYVWTASGTDGSGAWAASSGSGDMLLGTIQTVTALKTFNTATFALRNPANTFSYNFLGSAIVADRTVTLPLLTGTDTFVFNDFTATLTNKTIAFGSNTVSGTKAQFNTAVTDGDIVFLDSVDTITGIKTMSGLNIIQHAQAGLTMRNPANTFNYTFQTAAIAAARTITLPLLTGNDIMVTEAFTQTLTNKTINLTSNTFSGTKAQFNTAVTDGDILFVGDTIPLSKLAAAIAVNSIDNLNFKQTWNYSTLADDVGFEIISTSTLANSSSQLGMRVVINGINANSLQTTTAFAAVNQHTGTTSTNIAGVFTASGGSTANYSLILTGDVKLENTNTLIAASNATGRKLIFLPGTDVVGLNVGAVTANPTTPSNGDIYYNSTANELRARINGTWVVLGAGGGSGDMILASAQTSTGKKTFSVSGAVAGLNIGANATDPTTTLAAGDLYYQTGVGIRVYSGSAWSTVGAGGGGITNGAAANELMKSDGTNAVVSGLGSSALGNLDLGLSGTTGATRTIQATGSAADILIQILAKGSGDALLGTVGTGRAYLSAGGGWLLNAWNFASGTVAVNEIKGNSTSSTNANNAGDITILAGATTSTVANRSGSLFLASGLGNGTNSSSGHVYMYTGGITGSGLKGNIALGINTIANWQSMQNGMFIADSLLAPTGNPTNGLFKWVDATEKLARVRDEDGEIYNETTRDGTISVTFDSSVAASEYIHIRVPYAGKIVSWDVTTSDGAASSIVVDVRKGTFASTFPLGSGASIAGTEKPTLSSQAKNQDIALGTWTTAISEDDYIAFSVDSVSGLTGKVHVTLKVLKNS